MKLLLQATATMGIASVLSILFKMVGAKVVASALGPSGVGIYAQLITIAEIGATLSFMGLSAGIVRFASEFRSTGSWDKLHSLESTLIHTAPPFALLIGAGVAVFSGELSRVLLGSPSYGLPIALVAISLPLGSTATAAEMLVNAAKQFRLRACILAVTSLVGLVFLAPLVAFLGIVGAGAALAATAAFQAAFAWFFALRLNPRQPLTAWLSLDQFNPHLFARVFAYGATALATASIVSTSVLLVRTTIIAQMGPAANGIYQVVWASQVSWMGIAFSAYSSYFYPSYCEAQDLQSRCLQINRLVRFILLAATPFLSAYMLLRSEVVLALYTPQFLPAVPLLGISLLYGLLSTLAYCLNLPLLAAGKLRVIVALSALQQATFAVGSHLLLPVFQLHGVVYSSGIAITLATIASLAYSWRVLHIRLSASNVRTLVLSLLLVAAIYGLSELPRPVALGASLLLLLAWAHQVLDESEVHALRRVAGSALRRRAFA